MGVPDTSLLDLSGNVKTLLSRSGSDYSSQMAEINMDENMFGICSDCELKFVELSHKFFCRGCGRTFCSTCICRSGSLVIIAASDSVVKGCVLKNIIKSCKFCIRASKRRIEKIYPSESPRESPEPPSPCSGREKVMNGRDAEATIENDHVYDDPARAEHDISIYAVSNNNTISSIPNHLPPISVCSSQICATEDCRKHMFEPSRDHCHDSSDVDSCSVVSLRHECCSCKSSDSSPADSPSRINISYPRVGDSVHHEKEGSLTSHVDGTFDHRRVLLVKPERRTTNPANGKSGVDHLSILQSSEEKYQQPLDFENNDNLWFPPPPEHEDDETRGKYFEYDDDDDEIGESRGVFSSSADLSSLCSVNEKQSDVPEEPLSSAVHSHFRALVSQLLQGEDIEVTKENESEDWLGVVSNLAWLAAKSVKPDTKKGGSMDPGDYIKIKCLASGKPSQSTLVKGVVCTKNIKHKRMTSQYKNPRLLLLGGSLEYARVPNQLASFSTIFEEESDQLKLIVSRIEAHHTNVLLVEKSVSPIAQEYLLDKDISLVLNVKRTLLERIARCTGASITPSVDNIKSSNLGHCEYFRLEKVFEELEATKQPNKRPSKTLMFFEGCPRRLGCTILLKGSYREELKKIKKVIQYAVFAAYHLSLETSFLADEGASLPKMTLQPLSFVPEHTSIGNLIPAIANSALDDGLESSTEHVISVSVSMGRDDGPKDIASEGYAVGGSVSDSAGGSCFTEGYEDTLALPASEVVNVACSESPESPMVEELQHEELERVGEREVSTEYFSAQESSQSLLVSFSSRCVLKGTVCERSRLLRIKFYGSFDKPLGRYLRDDLFDQASYCRSCKEPIESHVQCYTHQQGSLTVNVRRMAAKRLPGQQDGKIWMWHRCLRCAQVDGYPPATHRVVMSDAAWGLSFGKFLELSFSNHTTANRIASCGHSMQRDCLRFYGCGDMVAFFHYSPIKILSVRLPPSVLEFDGLSKQQWLKKETAELKSKMESLYLEMAEILHDIEQKGVSSANGSSDFRDFSKHIVGLKDMLDKEKDEYYVLLHEDDKETPQSVQNDVDILDLNSLRHSLLLASRVWEHRFYCLDSLLKSGSSAAALLEAPWSLSEDTKSDGDRPVENAELLEAEQSSPSYVSSPLGDPNLEFNVSENYNLDSQSQEEISKDNEVMEHEESFERSASSISDKIDSAWIGTYLEPVKSHATHLLSEVPPRAENLPVKRLISPARVYSFDSATRLRERLHKASYLSSLRVRSFHATGDHKSMARDPASDVLRTYSQIPPHEVRRLSSVLGSAASYISSAAQVTEGARLLLPQMARSNLVIAVYDDEPTSLISYALSSNEHEDWVSNKLNGHERSLSVSDMNGDEFSASSISPWQSLGSVDLDYMGSEDLSPKISSFFYGAKKSPHLRVSFEDDSASTMGKAKFSVTCYFAKQFEMLRRKCCPSEVDIVSSLSRCKKWSAQGGKSNVYFAKSLDERFIVKQVSKTELESFGEFASEYFRYLNESLSSRSPTCLAKVLGIYQVSVRNMRGGKETKMDVMVMENLFFKKSVSRIYDLKGSSRSRYNADTSGKNNVLLDMNLLETLRTDPIFLGSKAKRSLERAIWNDTAFLASVDVMDYSLLVGVDEEKRELVVGIIDYMRQYTWDKHLETWVKASGILGGPKNASPTIVSPMQYKKRFRKAMTTYFLTVPDQLLS